VNAFSTDRMFENLEDRRLFSITTSADVVKVPGPTDVRAGPWVGSGTP